MYRMISICLLAFCVALCLHAEPIDWKNVQMVRPGVRLLKLEKEVPREKALTEAQLKAQKANLTAKKLPAEIIDAVKADVRPMKINVMRVDLRMKGLSFTGTGRAEGWGGKMPDHDTQIIRTKRLRTADFMKNCRLPRKEGGRGLDMIVANNTAPWLPWQPPYTHQFGNPLSLNISDGVVVTDNPDGPNAIFVVYRNGRIDIVDHIDTAVYEAAGRQKYDDIWLAHSGFGIIMKAGSTTPQTNTGYDKPLMPRMTIGLDKERHYLFLVTVDGRLPGWSEGATGTDLYLLMKDAGASDAIDMDGGGSATLCYWDDSKKTPQIVNRHDYKPGYYRPCGMNMGIFLKHDK